MNNLKKLQNIIRYNFLQFFNAKIFISCFLVVLLASTIMMNKINIYKCNINENINVWDYVFRVITSPFFLSWVLLPIMIFITFDSIKISNINNNILLRVKTKNIYILSKFLAISLIIILFLISLFIGLFIIGMIESNFNLSLNWSSAIKNESNLEILTNFLYVSNFIRYINPIIASILILLQFFLISIIIVLFRDFIFYCFKSTTSSIIITLIYLGYNFMYFGAIPYISTANIAIIWFHKFDNMEEIKTLIGSTNNVQTIQESLIISILLIMVLFFLNIRKAKRINAVFI